jgi:hypothetical protein
MIATHGGQASIAEFSDSRNLDNEMEDSIRKNEREEFNNTKVQLLSFNNIERPYIDSR